MNNYSILSSQSWQILKKYCIELDCHVQEIQNYIDFTNPNKVILNYTYSTKEKNFYSEENLKELGICHIDDEVVDGIDIAYLYTGQIVYNSFGYDLKIYNNNIVQQKDGSDVILKQGYAVFKIAEEPYFIIMSLDSEGDFYIVSNMTSDGEVIFSRLSHATVSLGMNYLFSFTGQNVRWFYYDYENNKTCYSPTNWAGFSLISWTWPEDHRIPLIMSPYRTIWTLPSTVSNEVLQKTNQDSVDCYEEVFCKEETSTESKGLDKGSLSVYSINTDMNNLVANALHLAVYLY